MLMWTAAGHSLPLVSSILSSDHSTTGWPTLLSMDAWIVSHDLQLQVPWAMSPGAHMEEMLSTGWNELMLGCVHAELY